MQGHLKLPEIQNNNLMKAHLKLHDTNVTIKKRSNEIYKSSNERTAKVARDTNVTIKS